MAMHPSQLGILRFFQYEHLRPDQAAVAEKCATLADEVTDMLKDTPHGAELTVGLRKLLEAKDAFVRASLFPD